MALLEEYVDAQVEENEYDAPAVLTVLKLYQLNPDKYRVEVASKILLKTLMALPRSDIVLAKCLINQPKVSVLTWTEWYSMGPVIPSSGVRAPLCVPI